jgi:hypothetical protein
MCQRVASTTYTYGEVVFHLKLEWSSFPRGDSHTPEAVKEGRDGVREEESIVERDRQQRERERRREREWRERLPFETQVW